MAETFFLAFLQKSGHWARFVLKQKIKNGVAQLQNDLAGMNWETCIIDNIFIY